MNKLTLTIFILIIIKGNSIGQAIDTNNVYLKALEYHLNAKYESDKNVKTEKVHLIEQDAYSTDNLPDHIGPNGIKIIDKEIIFELTKNKKSILLTAIRPARWKNGNLIIAIIQFKVTRKRNHFQYVNLGGSTYKVVALSNGMLDIKINK